METSFFSCIFDKKPDRYASLSVWSLLYCTLFTLPPMSLEKELTALLSTRYPAQRSGIAVLVIKEGKTIYQQGFGLANVATKEGITPQTTFRMASVSKQFTAMGIMLLVKQGKLSYDDNLLKFFPEFNVAVGSKIKVRHLLTHSSGIWDYEELIPETQKTQLLDEDVLGLLRTQSKTYFEPGSQFQYSNSGFCLLEQIIEKASGQRFADFMERAIFKPLGMTSTRIYEAPAGNIPHRAMGYARTEQGGWKDSDQSITSATKGDGCVYTSLVDYTKWYKALRTNRLIDPEAELKKVTIALPKNAPGKYGLGWFHAYNTKGQLGLYHTGSTCGFSNGVLLIPAQDYLFVYFSNSADNHEIEKDIISLLKKYNAYPDEFDFLKMLELTR
ncbi:serine hydrolase domain-containing protein [Runella sp.]|uniref:serine hydrolase domain-containing protein n=1 Tax=Runella sp. TaxID=1960881 RepID=UPI003D148482